MVSSRTGLRPADVRSRTSSWTSRAGSSPARRAGPGEGAVYEPRPGAAPRSRMLLGQSTLEARLLLRNGEQLLLTIVIPTLLLAILTAVPIVDIDSGRRIDFLTPGVLALAVMSTAFTGQAIATGYERRYGVLKWLGATPLPRWI